MRKICRRATFVWRNVGAHFARLPYINVEFFNDEYAVVALFPSVPFFRYRGVFLRA